MKPDDLDNLLASESRRVMPPAPDLRREVRAEIARRQARPSFWRSLLPVVHWNELLLQPRVAVGALALALVVGVLPSAVRLMVPSHANDSRFARASLHLDVFDSEWNRIGAATSLNH